MRRGRERKRLRRRRRREEGGWFEDCRRRALPLQEEGEDEEVREDFLERERGGLPSPYLCSVTGIDC